MHGDKLTWNKVGKALLIKRKEKMFYPVGEHVCFGKGDWIGLYWHGAYCVDFAFGRQVIYSS